MTEPFSPVAERVPSSTKLPPGWRWARLMEVARLESGHTPSRRRADYWGGDVPWLSLADIRGLNGRRIYETSDMPTELGIANSSARVLPRGTVSLCRTASVGKAVILGRDMATSQDFVNWVCGTELLPEYLHLALVGSADEFERLKQGSTHKTIYMPAIERFQVALPPLPEQHRIVAILDKASGILRRRQEGAELADPFLRSVFLDVFGEPATNPRGWPVLKIGHLVAGSQYGTATKANTNAHGLPVLRMNNLTYSGEIDLADLKWCPVAQPDIGKYTVSRGDLLFNRTNSPKLVGKTAVWEGDDGTHAYAGYLVRFRFDQSRVLPEYVSGFLNSGYGKRYLFVKAKPSNNMSNFSASMFRTIPIPVPPLEKQNHYKALRDAARQVTRRLEAAARCEKTLFDSLLQRAFRGEL